MVCFSIAESIHGFLDVSFNDESESFQNDLSQVTDSFHLGNNDSKSYKTRNRSQSESDIVNHTNNIVKHCLRSNQSYKNFENTAQLVNSTPGAKYQIPSTMYRIKKNFEPLLEAEYHIWCKKCKIYSPTTSIHAECQSCSVTLNRVQSEYFVYMSFEKQLKKSIEDNFDQILSYRESLLQNSESIRDVHDGVQFKAAQKKYPNKVILSLSINTDGAKMYNSTNDPIWPIQIYQNFLHPRNRYIPKNIMVVGLHAGKPNMQHFFCPFLKDLKKIEENGGISIQKNGKFLVFLPIITMVIADLPAKCEVQGMKGHAGYSSCSYCLHPGVLVRPAEPKGAKSKAVVRYIQINVFHISSVKIF